MCVESGGEGEGGVRKKFLFEFTKLCYLFIISHPSKYIPLSVDTDLFSVRMLVVRNGGSTEEETKFSFLLRT